MITFVHHPDDRAAVRRAYRELYPHEKDRCQLQQSSLAAPGTLIVIDIDDEAKLAERAVAWMREASEVYSGPSWIGETS